MWPLWATVQMTTKHLLFGLCCSLLAVIVQIYCLLSTIWSVTIILCFPRFIIWFDLLIIMYDTVMIYFVMLKILFLTSTIKCSMFTIGYVISMVMHAILSIACVMLKVQNQIYLQWAIFTTCFFTPWFNFLPSWLIVIPPLLNVLPLLLFIIICVQKSCCHSDVIKNINMIFTCSLGLDLKLAWNDKELASHFCFWEKQPSKHMFSLCCSFRLLFFPKAKMGS